SFVGSLSNIVSVTGIADGNFGNNSFSDLTKIIGISITPTQGTSATVTAGSSANYGFSVGLPANAGTVSFSATGLPTNSKVSFGVCAVGAGFVHSVRWRWRWRGNNHTSAEHCYARGDVHNNYDRHQFECGTEPYDSVDHNHRQVNTPLLGCEMRLPVE